MIKRNEIDAPHACKTLAFVCVVFVECAIYVYCVCIGDICAVYRFATSPDRRLTITYFGQNKNKMITTISRMNQIVLVVSSFRNSSPNDDCLSLFNLPFFFSSSRFFLYFFVYFSFNVMLLACVSVPTLQIAHRHRLDSNQCGNGEWHVFHYPPHSLHRRITFTCSSIYIWYTRTDVVVVVVVASTVLLSHATRPTCVCVCVCC